MKALDVAHADRTNTPETPMEPVGVREIRPLKVFIFDDIHLTLHTQVFGVTNKIC